jgi:hypothetical protein
MPVIYCNINIFDYDQSIYVLDDKGSHLIAKVPFTGLGKAMPHLCYDKNVFDVKLSCNVPGMAKQAAESIYAQANKEYGVQHKIDIEVQ